MKLLYAEDEKNMAEAVSDVLRYNNYLVDVVDNGEDALAMAMDCEYDMMILDIMMPGIDGLEVLEKLRKKGITTPVLLLSAKGEVTDRVIGLDLGADDYLAKPFAMDELLARIRAMLRRREEYVGDTLDYKDLKLDTRKFELRCKEASIILSKIEYQIMELLILKKDIYLSSETIFLHVWGYDSDADIGIVWVYISNLRKHLADLESEVMIYAKRNIGYRLK